MLPTVTEHNRPVILDALKKAKADIVFLASENLFVPSKMKKDVEQLKKEIPIFEKEGFSVGVWINSFGFGVPLEKEAYKQGWMKIKGMLGMKTNAFCPTDKKFRAYYASVLTAIAEAGAKTILLDDDYCLSIRPDVGCSCPRHARLLRRSTHLPLPGNVITALSTLGRPKKLRQKWLDVMGDSLRDFAKEMRSELDKKFPDVRMGLCAGYTSWDWEGVDAYELSKLLAGSTRPLLRLTGAPYWIYTRRFGNQSSADIIECTRMQLAWLMDKDVDVFAEDDSYPRPSYHVPAVLLDTLDTAVRAQGNAGNLKYMIDYAMNSDTETTYLDSHADVLSEYETIDKLFSDKQTVGVRVYEYARKAAYCYNSLKQNNLLERSFFSRAATMLANAGIPTKYEGSGLGICFGMNVKYLPESALSDGLILDYPAALYLTLQGMDVGLPMKKGAFYTLLKKAKRLSSDHEMDEESGEINHINAIPAPALYPIFPSVQNLYRAQINDNAVVLSRYADGSPSSYLYKNANGQRFCVYLFEGASLPFDSDLLLSYPRIRQLKKALAFLQSPPISYLKSNVSGVYLMTKKGENSLSIGIWNTRPDKKSFSVFAPGKLLDPPAGVTQTDDGFAVRNLAGYGRIYVEIAL